MASIDKNSAAMLGYPVIDDDHRAIVDRIDSLGELMAAGDGTPNPNHEVLVLAAIEALRNATDEHCRAEEEIMEKVGYQLLESHRRQHQDLIAEFMRFAPLFCSPQHDMARQTLDFLRNWNACHVKMWDAPLVGWLSERGRVKRGRPRA